ncbi:MAG TPA: hypothetical protein VKK06_14440, partial [Terriglobia bacterium]|nr:hypothetical protein [Terriglobia bacterium]
RSRIARRNRSLSVPTRENPIASVRALEQGWKLRRENSRPPEYAAQLVAGGDRTVEESGQPVLGICRASQSVKTFEAE